MGKRREELQRKISMTDYLMASVMKQKDMMVENFSRDVKMRKEKENEEVKEIISKYEQRKLQLEESEKKLRARESINQNENEKLHKEKKMNELANDIMLKVADNHKREKEKLEQKIMELQKKLDDKQGLELEIKQLKGAIMELIKHKTDKDVEAKKKFDSIKENLKEKEGEVESLKDLNQALNVRKQKINDELQDAHKELIAGMESNSSRAVIGVKRKGNLDRNSFMADAKLKGECDEDVYNAVVTALNECSPGGGNPLAELWNNRENRKATLKEGVEFILKQWKFYKQKKRG